jgi:hypothetical protein
VPPDDLNGSRAEHSEYRVSVDRVVSSGALAISVVTLTQLVQVEPHLGVALTVSLYCFAVSIPLTALDLVFMAVRLDRKRYQAPVLSSRDRFIYDNMIGVVGTIAAWIGTIAVFAYFSALAAIVYGIVGLSAFSYAMYCVLRYLPE